MSDSEDGFDPSEPPLPDVPEVTFESVGPLGVPMPTVEGVEIQSPIAPADGTDESDIPQDPRVEEPRSGDADPGGSADESASSGGGDPLGDAVELGESYIDRVEDALDHESCEFCRAALQQLRGLPMDEQIQGVRELKQLKDAMAMDTTADEVDQMLDDFDVVDETVLF